MDYIESNASLSTQLADGVHMPGCESRAEESPINHFEIPWDHLDASVFCFYFFDITKNEEMLLLLLLLQYPRYSSPIEHKKYCYECSADICL